MGVFDFLSNKSSNERTVEKLIQTVRSDPKGRYDALVSLKKIGDSKAIDTFCERLNDPSPRIRRISIEALGEMGNASAISPLAKLINTNDFSLNRKRTNFGHPENIELAKQAIRKIQQRSPKPEPIKPAPLPSPSPPYENWTNEDIQLLKQSWNKKEFIQTIVNRLNRSPESVIHKLIETGLIGYNDDNCDPKPAQSGLAWSDQERTQLISELNAGKSITEIAKIHQRNKNSIFHMMVKLKTFNYIDRSLLEKYTENNVPPDNNKLIRTLISELENNSNIDLRKSAATQLGFFHEPSVVNALIKSVKNDPDVRYLALAALRNIGDPTVTPVFIEHSKDPSTRIRLVSVKALGEIGDSSVIKPLESLIKSKDYQNTLKYGGNPEIIQAARDAIQKIRSREKDTRVLPVIPQQDNGEIKDASDLNQQGFRLAKMKKFEDAIILFKKALQIDNNFIDALNNHGWASSQLGRYEEAISYYENAKKIDPNNVRAWRAIGWNLARIHRYDEALTHINAAITLDSQSGRSWNYKGEILFFKGDLKDAITCFEKALNLDPQNKDARENLIRVQKKPTSSIEEKSLPLDTSITARPKINLVLSFQKVTLDTWEKREISVTNEGSVNAKNVKFDFSDDVDVRRITTMDILSGETKQFEIPMKAKAKGIIPLDITVTYRDALDKSYSDKFDFDIEVVETITATPSPVDRFTPKPLTLKQLPPDLSERYPESEFIGKGGFARVFKAKRKDGQYVAVKIPISLDESTGRSFIAEMQSWTRLSHTNIVKLYDFNIMPVPYFEMELCDTSLDKIPKPIEPAKAAWILFNICDGLKYTHSHKIIHRDLKPHNILLKDGIPKISDWGLAKVIAESTTTSASAFTFPYAAPEQVRSKSKDERTDIWQMGVILYEITTGKLPFASDDPIGITMQIASEDPEKPSAINPECKDLEPVILKCLEKDPAKRYQSVFELQKDLAAFLRVDFTQSLTRSMGTKDFVRSAYLCCELLQMSMKIDDITSAKKYADTLVNYTDGENKKSALELVDQLKVRIDHGLEEIPIELIEKADFIAHNVRLGSGNIE